MLLTVLFGELLIISILLLLVLVIKIKWIQVTAFVLIVLSFFFAAYYTINPTMIQFTSTFPYVEKIDTVKADLNDKKVQLSVDDFKESAKDYDYVTYTELSQNNSLYQGKMINQWGRVKKVIANNHVGRELVLDLDESNSSSLILVDYHLSDLAKGIPNVKVNDRIKVFGEGSSQENGNGKPVINAHFIKYE
ncbi:hypothetical protein [Companilactobacillus furfuricola]|uniref:hypothetical protein n=1 Tax=Companilactobacillus furfuricola TaxID=1462575 RepID=UPI000F796684|nr:hypothetical protein [Companilactobacillus furfuricola]